MVGYILFVVADNTRLFSGSLNTTLSFWLASFALILSICLENGWLTIMVKVDNIPGYMPGYNNEAREINKGAQTDERYPRPII